MVSKFLTGKPTGKRILGRPRHRCKGNIRINLNEVGVIATNWFDSALNRDHWKPLGMWCSRFHKQ